MLVTHGQSRVQQSCGLSAISQSQARLKKHHIHYLRCFLLHNTTVLPVRFQLTCVGDLGRAGAGDAGASIWLGLAVGLGRGETSSGGEGVFAKRRGPESLDRSKAMVRTYISFWPWPSNAIVEAHSWCNASDHKRQCTLEMSWATLQQLKLKLQLISIQIQWWTVARERLILSDLGFWNICLPDDYNLRKTVPAFCQILSLKECFVYKVVAVIKLRQNLLPSFHTVLRIKQNL